MILTKNMLKNIKFLLLYISKKEKESYRFLNILNEFSFNSLNNL